jgi:hypothetical protein
MMRLLLIFLASLCSAQAPFRVHVVDEATGRGVPLIELRTMNELAFFTDSNGIAVIEDPAFQGQRVFFKISGHGYVCTQKVFDDPGAVLTITPGAEAKIKVRRTNIAERLYRITGAGIYHDSVLAGLPVPLKQPLLNGLVTGQDTAIATPYQGKLFWCWGDTLGPANMNFNASCATSEMPGKGGLDPSVGVDLTYFVERSGFAKNMLKLPQPGLVWLEGLFTVKDNRGRERLVATYTRQPGLKPPDERGVAVFNDSEHQFDVLAQLPWRGSHCSSHPFRVTENGKSYWYLYPNQRVPDDWKAIQNPQSYESFVFTRRNADGSPHWEWKAGADMINATEERKRVAQGQMKPDEALFALVDVDIGKDSGARPGSVAWNGFRKKWIMLADWMGSVYYAEANQPAGPWPRAKKIVAHNRYNFYNVVHHPFFDQEGGRVIYFEGTYTDAFSGAPEKTPRYEYNQIMYRLRLDDPRLESARK